MLLVVAEAFKRMITVFDSYNSEKLFSLRVPSDKMMIAGCVSSGARSPTLSVIFEDLEMMLIEVCPFFHSIFFVNFID